MSMITIHNTETGEIIEREMNEAELAQHQIDAAAEKARIAEAKAKAKAKAALLEKLGITEEEAKLLLG
jgi:AmiR/NasT family two-component response regulator